MAFLWKTLGDGQLGRFLAQAAHGYGLTPVVLGKDRSNSAGQVALHELGDYEDCDTVFEFGRNAGVLTFELEGVSIAGMKRLVEAGVVVEPSPTVLEAIQDKYQQKQLFESLGIPVVKNAAARTSDAVRRFAKIHGYPVMLKQRLGSYDGYGNYLVVSESELETAFDRMRAKGDVYVEAYTKFTRELAITVIRGADGQITCYPLVESRQTDGMCDWVIGPVVCNALPVIAEAYARKVAVALGHVGALAIEFFEVNGILVANEMAPRVHNSAHWTLDGAKSSQFQGHVCATMNWPLPSTDLTCTDFAIANLLSPQDGFALDPYGLPLGLPEALEFGVQFYGYGKGLRPRRKLGHLSYTHLGKPGTGIALERVLAARECILSCQ